jgi:hypothetical protein
VPLKNCIFPRQQFFDAGAIPGWGIYKWNEKLKVVTGKYN